MVPIKRFSRKRLAALIKYGCIYFWGNQICPESITQFTPILRAQPPQPVRLSGVYRALRDRYLQPLRSPPRHRHRLPSRLLIARLLPFWLTLIGKPAGSPADRPKRTGSGPNAHFAQRSPPARSPDQPLSRAAFNFTGTSAGPRGAVPVFARPTQARKSAVARSWPVATGCDFPARGGCASA